MHFDLGYFPLVLGLSGCDPIESQGAQRSEGASQLFLEGPGNRKGTSVPL